MRALQLAVLLAVALAGAMPPRPCTALPIASPGGIAATESRIADLALQDMASSQDANTIETTDSVAAGTGSAGPAGALGFVDWILGRFARWKSGLEALDIVLGSLLAILGSIVGWFAKLYATEYSARTAARRAFAQTVTERISELATTRYWSLANYAGVVAGQLEGYIHRRNNLLLSLSAAATALRPQLEQEAQKAAETSFYFFCRLIDFFNDFQFENSNTYLLTSHASGEGCKRLYNAFVESLGEDGPDTLTILGVLRSRISAAPRHRVRPARAGDGGGELIEVHSLPAMRFNQWLDQGANGGDPGARALYRTREAYRKWLLEKGANVTVAAESLRAYSELLSHELALLYKDWFARKPTLTRAGWPGVISEETFGAIERAELQSSVLRPIGTAYVPERLTAVATAQAPTAQQRPQISHVQTGQGGDTPVRPTP